MFLNSCGKRSGRIAASATRDGTRIRCQGQGSCTIRCLSFRWVARRFPARGWVLAEQTRIWIPLGGTAIPRHRLGSRGRLLLAFCRAVTARRKPAHSLFRLYSVLEAGGIPRCVPTTTMGSYARTPSHVCCSSKTSQRLSSSSCSSVWTLSSMSCSRAIVALAPQDG